MSSIILIIGTFLLASEAIGRDRITKWEIYLRKFSASTQNILGNVLIEMLPQKKRKGQPKLRDDFPIGWIVDRVFHLFLLISVISWLFVFFVYSLFGEVKTFIGILACWTLCATDPIYQKVNTYLLSLWARPRQIDTVIKLALISILWFLFNVSRTIGFVGTLLTSFPASLIYLIYFVFFLICRIISNVIKWKESHNMGNVFLIFGLFITLLGIVLQHFNY